MNNLKQYVRIRSRNMSLLFILIFLLMGFVLNPRSSKPKILDKDINESTKIASVSATVTQEPPPSSMLFLVSKVIDGDTIQLSSGEKVRYIGINTPERGRCLAKESTEANKQLVLNKMVRLEKDVSETDRYGRLLRYVYVDETFVNDQLVRNGFARATTYPPDIKHQAQFSEAERDARRAKEGLWKDGGCDFLRPNK